jgi:NhaC family Na+:H+ antiporter
VREKVDKWKAMGILVLTAGMFFTGILLVKAPSAIVLIASGTVAMLLAMVSGVEWDELQDGLCKSISAFIPAILIILSVGMLIAAWVISGTIPFMIYYGLKILTPSWFLIAALLICTVMSVTTGTSWGTIGTVGIALMGISTGLGVPLAYTAGAIVMGAVFGDKLSPLSDTTVLASAVSGVYIFDHVKYMLWTTIPPYIAGILLYLFLGAGTKGSVESEQLALILSTLSNSFSLNPVLILPPLVVLALVAMKKPVLPIFAAGVIIAVFLASVVQHVNLKDISLALFNGYTKATGVGIVDNMLLRGGVKSMTGTVLLPIAAAVFGVPLQKVGVIDILIEYVHKFAKTSRAFLSGMFFIHSFLFMITSSYYVTFAALAPMIAPVYDDLKLHRANLSRMLEDTGTAFAPIVPWSVTGVFIASTLSIPTIEFALYAPITYGGMICELAYILFNFKIATSSTVITREGVKQDYAKLQVQ